MQLFEAIEKIIALKNGTETIDYKAIEKDMIKYDSCLELEAVKKGETILGDMPILARQIHALGWVTFRKTEAKIGNIISKGNPNYAMAVTANRNMELMGKIMWAIIEDEFDAASKSLTIREGPIIVERAPTILQEITEMMGTMRFKDIPSLDIENFDNL